MMRLSLIAALAFTVLLSACGTSKVNPIRSVLSGALKQVTNKKAPQQVMTTDILRSRLTPEVLAQIGATVMIVEMPVRKIAVVVSEVAQNGDVKTWFTQDGVGLSTRSGMLISTRGIGSDLMSSGVKEPLAVVTGAGTGIATRTHRFLDGENQEVLFSFECTYVGDKNHRPSHVTETCNAKELTIENHYWLNGDGEIWRSKQWIGQRNGYILLENAG